MDETTQQIIALAIVALAVLIELLRRYRKKRSGKAGCDGCDTPAGENNGARGETPLRFYKRSK